MATADGQGNNLHADKKNPIGLALKILCILLGGIGAVSGILEFPNLFKIVILGFTALFWVFFEFNPHLHDAILNLIWNGIQQRQGIPSKSEKEAQTPAVRWGLW